MKFLYTPSLKIICWLSHDNAVQTLQRTVPAVQTASREGAEYGEPAAIGLIWVMKCYEFLVSLNFMWEVLPQLSRLFCLVQAKYILLSTITCKPYLNCCTKALESYKIRARATVVAATDSALADQLQQVNARERSFCKTSFQLWMGLKSIETKQR